MSNWLIRNNSGGALVERSESNRELTIIHVHMYISSYDLPCQHFYQSV